MIKLVVTFGVKDLTLLCFSISVLFRAVSLSVLWVARVVVPLLCICVTKKVRWVLVSRRLLLPEVELLIFSFMGI